MEYKFFFTIWMVWALQCGFWFKTHIAINAKKKSRFISLIKQSVLKSIFRFDMIWFFTLIKFSTVSKIAFCLKQVRFEQTILYMYIFSRSTVEMFVVSKGSNVISSFGKTDNSWKINTWNDFTKFWCSPCTCFWSLEVGR